jgi:hypothetical protein
MFDRLTVSELIIAASNWDRRRVKDMQAEKGGEAIRDRTSDFGDTMLCRCLHAEASPLPWEHHLRLNHHRSELSVRAVDRDLQDDSAPPDMDRHSNAGKPF